MNPDHDSPEGRFRTTRWTAVLLSAQSQASGAREALAELCRIYWYPIYAFVRRHGYSPEDARICLVCGTQFPVAREFCPVCMLREALDEEVNSGVSSPEQNRAEPAPSRLPHRFEHYQLVTDKDGKPVELGRGAMGIYL